MGDWNFIFYRPGRTVCSCRRSYNIRLFSLCQSPIFFCSFISCRFNNSQSNLISSIENYSNLDVQCSLGWDSNLWTRAVCCSIRMPQMLRTILLGHLKFLPHHSSEKILYLNTWPNVTLLNASRGYLTFFSLPKSWTFTPTWIGDKEAERIKFIFTKMSLEDLFSR